MSGRITFTGVILGVLSIGAITGWADTIQRDFPSRGHDHGRGYIPWSGDTFGYTGFYPAGASSGPQQQSQGVYDIAPAVGQAAFAGAEFDNRWAELQVLIDRERKDFEISNDYMAAKKTVADARTSYESAVDVVLSRLQDDKEYKALIEKRTEQQVALKQTGVDTGIHNVLAAEKLRYGAMASQLEAVALTNDTDVQAARERLVEADEALRLMEKRFESQLYNRPEVVAERQQMEAARANKAGADGYLRGAIVTRADQLNLNDANNTGNSVYLTGIDPYMRGYYGLGAF